MADHTIDFAVSITFADYFDGTQSKVELPSVAIAVPPVVLLESAIDKGEWVSTFLIPGQDARESPEHCKAAMHRITDLELSRELWVPDGKWEYWQVGGYQSYYIVECRVGVVDLFGSSLP